MFSDHPNRDPTAMDDEIDKVRSYWNARPCNVMHSSKPRGTREYWDEVELKKYHVEPHIPRFASFSSWKGKRVLELGCGLGTDTLQFLRAGARITSIDLSESSVQLARERMALYGFQDADIRVGNIENVGELVNGETFDLVYSFGVIHHTPNPTKVFQQIPALLKPNGEFRCMVYAKYSYKLFWLLQQTADKGAVPFGRETDELVQRFSEAQEGCPFTCTYSAHRFCTLLHDVGFQTTHAWKDHIFPYEIEPYKQHEYVLSPAFAGMSRHDFQDMTSELGWHLMVRATVNKRRRLPRTRPVVQAEFVQKAK